MKTLLILLLSDHSLHRIGQWFNNARAKRGMPSWIAAAYVALTALAYIFLRLEGPAWLRLRASARP